MGLEWNNGEGVFKWVDGSEAPNDMQADRSSSDDNCATIEKMLGYKANDCHCNLSKRFVCQYLLQK